MTDCFPQRDFGPDKYDTIPPHGRWQHFEVGNVARIEKATQYWRNSACDDMEVTRRLIDLFFVSVILDAGAGDFWRYVEPGTDREYERSEGIAVASLYMFNSLAFTASKIDGRPTVDGMYSPISNFPPDSRSFLRKGPGAIVSRGSGSRLPIH